MKLTVRDANLWDAIELAGTMRQADRDELDAGTPGRDPLEALEDGLAISAECKVALTEDGKVVAIWGVVPGLPSVLGPRLGIGWLLTSDQVDLYPLAFFQETKAQLRELLDRWDGLVNAIWAGHEKALRWARHLGFRVCPAEPAASGAPFHPFYVDREAAHV